jgi:hypothetical protein
MGTKYTVPAPAQGRVSDVGNGLDTPYRLKSGVVPAELLRATGGTMLKNTPIAESLPVKPSEPAVEVGGKSWRTAKV